MENTWSDTCQGSFCHVSSFSVNFFELLSLWGVNFRVSVSKMHRVLDCKTDCYDQIDNNDAAESQIPDVNQSNQEEFSKQDASNEQKSKCETHCNNQKDDCNQN